MLFLLSEQGYNYSYIRNKKAFKRGDKLLSLKKIRKVYKSGDFTVEALKGISVDFRDNEFVSILGPSGCGKTTLLNIIGGLDQYTDGDLTIAGRSTKLFSSHDWDSYRNHSIGFVFQTYNLISHQSILSNVELALTLSGVPKAERRRRAKEALEKVGLEEHISKRPNQLSGGQMQRVAIARALVNDPEILLADEPTGALDSETSLQIMELLKEIARDRLVIMVTHNPELADAYSTRIIKLLDGKIVDDSDPYEEKSKAETPTQNKSSGNKKSEKNSKYTKTSMSFFTALSLSLNNLMTKKGRTALISFAGSIGIIGIALILSLSSGINAFIATVQKDTLSSYPIQIQSENMDMSSLIEAFSGKNDDNGSGGERADNRVYKNTIMNEMLNTFVSASAKKNDLAAFKKYLETTDTGIDQYVSAISYGYDINPLVYSQTDNGELKKINPSTVFESLYGDNSVSSYYQDMMQTSGAQKIWGEILPDKDGEGINPLVKEQYDIVHGKWPEAFNEVVIFISDRNEINDMVLYSLGLKDPDELQDIMKKIMAGEEIPTTDESWSYDELCALEYTLLLPGDIYQKNSSGTYDDMSQNDAYMTYRVNSGVKLKVVGIARPNDSALATTKNGDIGYTKALTQYLITESAKSEICRQQLSEDVITADNNPYKNSNVIGYRFNEIDVFTGTPFKDAVKNDAEPSISEKASRFIEFVEGLTNEEKADLFVQIQSKPTQETVDAMLAQYIAQFPDRPSIEAAIKQYYSSEAGVDASEIDTYLQTLSDEELTATITEAMTTQIKKSYAEDMAKSLAAYTSEQLVPMLDELIRQSDEDRLAQLNDGFAPAQYSDSSLEENIALLELYNEDQPSSVNIYAVSFEAKEAISDIIDTYNASKENETEKLSYTDYIALMMSSVSIIIDAISYVLIAFVSISLVVSSIMIGIITYISVLERTKEIGILRAIGASKRDISRVFNAEAIILGFASGMLGIIITVLLNLPITAIIRSISEINGIASVLPIGGGIILVAISMFLTFIAGLIPSRIAAKKDPVVALRTE